MTEQATFAAGCFWGVEAAFRELPGVLETCVGYTGGHTPNPTYEQVCTDTTGHAEAIQITFDPGVIAYNALVATFFRMHNPTQLNRQGPDVGSQYRSAIFTHTPEQAQTAHAMIAAVQATGKYCRPIVTEVTPASDFYPAEAYHQRYLEKHGGPSCHF